MHAHIHYGTLYFERDEGKGCSVEMWPVSRTWGKHMQLHHFSSQWSSPPSLRLPLLFFSNTFSPLHSILPSSCFGHEATSWGNTSRQNRTEQWAKPSLKPRSEAGALRVRAIMITCCWSECINRVVPYYRFSFIMYLCGCYNKNQQYIPKHTYSTAGFNGAKPCPLNQLINVQLRVMGRKISLYTWI